MKNFTRFVIKNQETFYKLEDIGAYYESNYELDSVVEVKYSINKFEARHLNLTREKIISYLKKNIHKEFKVEETPYEFYIIVTFYL